MHGTKRTNGVAFLAGLLALAATGAWAAPLPIAATVAWSEGGSTGEARFQGVADGRLIKGTLSDGTTEIWLHGTIAPDGAVAGTLRRARGGVLGTFQARMENGALTGGYAVLQGSHGAWSADARALPVPRVTLGR